MDSDAQFVSSLTDCQTAIAMYVRSLMPGDRSAADIVQQANAKIWERRADYQSGTNFRAWAMTLARYEVLSYRKQQARDSRLHFSDELESTIASEMDEVDLDLGVRQQALRHCIEGMSEENRSLIFLRYESQESLKDFAERTRRSLGGLKVKLHRLRSSLAQCIENRMVATGDAS